MYQLPVFILGGCAALLIEKFYKKGLTQSEKAIKVQKQEKPNKKVSHETTHDQDPITELNNGNSGGDNSEKTGKKSNSLGEIPNVD